MWTYNRVWYSVCVGDTYSMILLTLNFALAFLLWKQARNIDSRRGKHCDFESILKEGELKHCSDAVCILLLRAVYSTSPTQREFIFFENSRL